MNDSTDVPSLSSFILCFFFLFSWTILSVCLCRHQFRRVFRIFVARDIGPDGEPDSSIPGDTPSIIAIPVYPNKTKCLGSCVPWTSVCRVYTRIIANAMRTY